MEVMISSPAVDFNFDTASTSPYVISSASSPNHSGNCFFSAPTSPTRTTSSSTFFRHFNTSPGDSLSTIPFGRELKSRTPMTEDNSSNHDGDDDFEFDFSGQLERTTLPAADELFQGGKLKPSTPPPPPPNGVIDSPKPPINTKNGRETPSARNMKADFDPFAAKIEQSHNSQEKRDEHKEKRERGRERPYNSSASSRKQRGTRSLSPPLRVCEIFCESHRKFSDSSPPSKAKESSSKKWRLKDLWVFGSASEGSNKEELKKYSLLKKSGNGEDAKESSFRSTESGGGGASVRRRGVAVSAHERHYAAKKAAVEEMRRKTLLPYKYGLMGCFGFNFNPAVHDISKGLGSLTRG